MKQNPGKFYIYKSAFGSRGRGIFLTNAFEELSETDGQGVV